MPRTLSLEIYKHGELVEQKTLAQDVVKIGKLGSSHVCLHDDAVARMHAVIEINGSEARVIDLGSAGGTLLNDRRVEKSDALQSGDVITLGPYRIDVQLDAKAVAQRPTMAIDAREVELHDGRHVAEVVATYHGTILDAQHVGQVESRSRQAPLFLGAGAALIVGGLALFGSNVIQDWDAWNAAAAQAADEGRPQPAEPGNGLGGLGLALAFLGLVPFGFGVVRRDDVALASYTVGESGAASFAMDATGLPDRAAFPLVSERDGAYVLSFTAAMSGDVTFGNEAVTLAELAHSGRATASGSTYRLPLPEGARCRVHNQGLTFLVNTVPAGRAIAKKSEADKPFWIYSGGSLAVLGGLLALVHLVPDDALAMDLDDPEVNNRFVGYMNQPDDPPEIDPVSEDEAKPDAEAGEAGQRHKGDEGAMGKPTATVDRKLYAIKGPKDAIPQMARQFDPDMQARDAGILGEISKSTGHFLASPYGGAFAIGNDDEDAWGTMTGTEIGEAYGVGGLGLVGSGRGGGGNGEGTIGLTHHGLIGRRGGGGTCGDRSCGGYGRRSGTALGTRIHRGPTTRIAKGVVHGTMDKDVIRRIVRAHINEVRACYNQGLTRDPSLEGRVAVQFTIGPTGAVPAAVVSETSIKDKDVAQCIARAVQRWSFPRPPQGGNVIVTYPFVLSPG